MEGYEKTEIVCLRLAIGLIKELDEEVIRVNKLSCCLTDRSKLIRKAIENELVVREELQEDV